MKRGRAVLALIPLLLGLASTTYAATGIDTVIRFLETRYSTRHHGIPGLWLAKPFLFGSGVSGLKIAAFESLHIPADEGDSLPSELNRELGEDWNPFIETWSKGDGEWSVIYARSNGNRLELLIVDSDGQDGVTVLQMKLSGKALDEWVSEPRKSRWRTHSQMARETSTAP